MALILRPFEQLLGHRDVDDVRDTIGARLIADLRDPVPDARLELEAERLRPAHSLASASAVTRPRA